MQSEEVEQVLAGLEPGRRGWVATLPEEATFHGKPVELRIQTESVPTGQLPPPTDEMLALARLILADSDSVLRDAEREYAGYHEDYDPDADEKAEGPRIWIDVDALLDDGPMRWAFVVGRKDAEDYGTHIEFEGTRVLEVWSGD